MTLWMTLCKLLTGLFALATARRARPTVGDRIRFRHMIGQWFDGVIVQAANQNGLWWVDYRNSKGGMGTTLCFKREFVGRNAQC